MIKIVSCNQIKVLVLSLVLLPCVHAKIVLSRDEKNDHTKPHIYMSPITHNEAKSISQPVIRIDMAFIRLSAQAMQRYKAYTIHDWHHYISSCDPTGHNISVHQWSQENRNEVLCQFNFYRFPAFRAYIATLEGYHEAIVTIHNRLTQDKIFAAKLKTISLGWRYNTEDFICEQVEQSKIIASENYKRRQTHDQLYMQQQIAILEQQKIARKTQESISIVQTQREELEAIIDIAQSINNPQSPYEKNINNRAYAMKKTIHENFAVRTEQYIILPSTDALLNTIDRDSSDLLQCHGSAIQQLIHHELITSLNCIGGLYAQYGANPKIEYLAKSAAEFAHVGIAYNNAGYVKQAFEISNLVSAFCDYGKAIAYGVGDGIGNVAYALTHPLDTISSIGKTASTVGYYLGKVMYEIGEIDLTYRTDPAVAEAKLAVLEQNFLHVMQEINQKYLTMSGPDMVRGITSGATEAWLTGKVLGAAERFYSHAHSKLVEFTKKVEQGLATAPELLASAEGLEVRIANQAAETVMLSSKQGLNETCRASLLRTTEDMASYIDTFKSIGLNPISKRDLKHIFKNHIPGGQYAVLGERSVFHEHINVIELAIEAWSKGTGTKAGQKIFDTGNIIGFTIDGIPTTKVSISLNGTHDAIKTIFPI